MFNTGQGKKHSSRSWVGGVLFEAPPPPVKTLRLEAWAGGCQKVVFKQLVLQNVLTRDPAEPNSLVEIVISTTGSSGRSLSLIPNRPLSIVFFTFTIISSQYCSAAV